METNKLIDRLRELSKIGIVNYKHDTPVLIEAADRIEELDERIAIMQESMETLEKRQEWVSVKDRLPKEKINPLTMDFQNVICFCDFGGVPKRTDIRTYGYGTPIGHKEAHFWHGPQIMDGVITHWMPLPEPPKEVSE